MNKLDLHLGKILEDYAEKRGIKVKRSSSMHYSNGNVKSLSYSL